MNKIIIALYVLATTSALVLLKYSSSSGAPLQYNSGKLHFNINVYTVLGTLLYGSSFLLYTYLVAKFDLGFIIPLVTGLVYLFIFFASYFIFKEAFSPYKIIGIGLILGGVFFMNLHK